MKLILDNKEDEYIDYYDDYDADGEKRSVLFRIHHPQYITNISDNFTKRGSAGLITLGLVSFVLIAGIVGLIMGAKHFRYFCLARKNSYRLSLSIFKKVKEEFNTSGY